MCLFLCKLHNFFETKPATKNIQKYIIFRVWASHDSPITASP